MTAETETQRRARLAERIAQIAADGRYPPALKDHLIAEETRRAEEQIADMADDGKGEP